MASCSYGEAFTPSSLGANVGDCAFFGAGAKSNTQQLLGAVRQEVGERCGLIDENEWAFLWIVDAPMFEKTDEGGWTAVHHPFTSPNSDWVDRFEEAPLYNLHTGCDTGSRFSVSSIINK